MALTTCKRCGKKISNTVASCIHCGASTELPITKETEREEDFVVNDESDLFEALLPQFNELQARQQKKLENEFLKADKKMKRYRRKGVEGKKYGALAIGGLFISRILLVLQKLAIEKVFEGAIYNPDAITKSEQALVPILAVWVFSIVMCFYSLSVFRKRRNKMLYAKKFQKWLWDEKTIIYKPNFITEKDKKVFEDIKL